MIRLGPWAGVSVLLFTALAAAGADLERGLAAIERRDWAAALAEFQPLAEQGVAAAAVNLGNLYMKGLGVPEDYAEALRWFRKAADQGNEVAQDKLGLMHYYGFGTAEDHAEAARWFRLAAGQGEPGAAAILGTLYAAGDGVVKDKVQAYFWFTLAADHGHAAALQNRNALVEEMSPGEINDALERLADWRRRNEPPDAAPALPGAGSSPPQPAPPKKPSAKAGGRSAGNPAKHKP